MGSALTTDFYELSMVASYLRRGMSETATFSLFVRNMPPVRGFLVAAGLEDCLAYLESLAFDDDEVEWLGGIGFAEGDLERFASLRFTGDVVAVPEGRVILAGEPLLEVTAPIAEAQLVETYLLNQVTFQTAVATKAARCRLAAGEIELADFALRRTHGAQAGLAAARAAAIAGFTATSNVDAARRHGLALAGTMAHSYVEAFPSEEAAFRAFAEDFPARTTFLVDTYDTAGGVEAAIRVIKDLDLPGPLAVRLDSGDLAQLAAQARRQLDDAGLERVRIFVSGGLDEYGIERLRRAGAPVDAAGVGTRMGVSEDAPSLDSVYKLVALGGRPVVKLSSGKETLPGPKQVWRGSSVDLDVLATRDEPGPAGAEALLVPVMAGGERLAPTPTIEQCRSRLERDLEVLPATARRIGAPEPPHVTLSRRLADVTAQVRGGG